MAWSEKVMLNISRSVSSAWTHLWCLHRSSLSPSIFLRKTAGDLLWLRRHGRGYWSQYSYSECQFYLYHDVWECFEWVFVQKRRLLIFSHWLTYIYNRQVAKLVTNIEIPRWKFYKYCYGNQSLKEDICEEPELVYKHPSPVPGHGVG